LPGLAWPGRGGEEALYYRFDLTAIHTLPQVITNPERIRVAFRFPELGQLEKAETLGDLGHGTPHGGKERRRPRRAAVPRESKE
jgi:hypothetical protein